MTNLGLLTLVLIIKGNLIKEFDFKIIKGNLIKEEDDWEENYTRLLMVGDLFPRQKIPWGS